MCSPFSSFMNKDLFCFFDDFDEAVCFQTCTTDQSTVDIRLCHIFSDVVQALQIRRTECVLFQQLLLRTSP